jgi:hypothetical protein
MRLPGLLGAFVALGVGVGGALGGGVLVGGITGRRLIAVIPAYVPQDLINYHRIGDKGNNPHFSPAFFA